ncbi:hypothetical protein JCM14036_06570 [Desulfotomaculum defluvii]
MLKDVSERAEYVGILLSLATMNEKVTPSQKEQVALILKNYQVPEDYLEEIWKKINFKFSVEELLIPIQDKDNNYKVALLQELTYFFLSNGTYGQRKVLLNKIAGEFGFKVDLEGLKNHVLEMAKRKK